MDAHSLSHMSVETLEPEAFFNAPGALIDVRSPGEYAQGHFPGAFNLPLFSNDERALVGTTYKQDGHVPAVQQGLELVGPKLGSFAKEGHALAERGCLKLYCWRGGMRSASMAWLMKTAGLQAVCLKGGYKAFRSWVLTERQPMHGLRVIGGLTGCGKTRMLQSLKKRGAQVLDLEALASHRGSSYGSLGISQQPTNEQFENMIAWEGRLFDWAKPVWVEDESRLIGSCKVPDALFAAMRKAPLYIIEKPTEERLDCLVNDYSACAPALLIECTQRLAKKLGSARTNEIISLIASGELRQGMRLMLDYYDSAYQHALSRREKVHRAEAGSWTDDQWIEKLLSWG